jgi:hypothetical protein
MRREIGSLMHQISSEHVDDFLEKFKKDNIEYSIE